MSGFAWLILDALLVLAAVVGTSKVSSTPPPKAIPPEQLEISPERAAKATAGKNSKDGKTTTGTQTASQKTPTPQKNSLDDLWKQTLFLPTRAEEEPTAPGAEETTVADANAGQNLEFELVGIAQITPADKIPVPVAILRNKQTTTGRKPKQRSNRPAVHEAMDKNKGAKPVAEEKKTPPKTIFKEGDRINDTGYLIKAIHPKERMVEVSRGSETIKLYMNFASEEATKRRADLVQENAKKQEAAQQEQQRQESIRARQAQEKQAQAQANTQQNPGQPPPPPGMASPDTNNSSGNGGNAAANGNANRDQLREKVEQNANSRGGNSRRDHRRSRQQDGENSSENGPTR